MENELILFETADKEIKLTVPIKNNTVWLNRKQLAELFGRDVKTIGKHINNALKEELDNSVVANFATTASDGKVYQVEHYNLDMIISVGYRVKSNRGVEFRKWANSVLKQYIIQGYAINEKRLEALQRTINIQTKMLACTLEVDEAEVLKAVSSRPLYLLQTYFTDTTKTVVIVCFCKIILGTPGFNIHSLRSTLAVADLLCPLLESDLLSHKAGLCSHNIPPDHSKLKKLSTKLF